MANPRSDATPPKGSASQPGRTIRLGRWVANLPLHVVVIVIVFTIAIAITFGASRPYTGNPVAPQVEVSMPSVFDEPLSQPIEQRLAPENTELRAYLAALESDNDLLIGVSIAPLSQPVAASRQSWNAGTLHGSKALSTIDLPMGLALINNPREPDDPDYMLRRTIVDHSDAGQEAIWAFLGTSEEAARKLTLELRHNGDYSTTLPSTASGDDAPYRSVYWTLDDQSHFMGSVACNYVSNIEVLSQMNKHRGQLWGLQHLPMNYSIGDAGVANGVNLVRQTGVIYLADGTEVAVSIAITSPTISTQDLKDTATDVAYKVRNLATGFDAPQCS